MAAGDAMPPSHAAAYTRTRAATPTHLSLYIPPCPPSPLQHRLVLAEIALQKPHILLFDEPTNASDLEGVDSLAEAINAYQGGVIVISHDFRLLSQIIDGSKGGEIWIVDHGISKVRGHPFSRDGGCAHWSELRTPSCLV